MDSFVVAGDYNEKWIEALKQSVPAAHRNYAKGGGWTIRLLYLALVYRLCKQHYQNVSGELATLQAKLGVRPSASQSAPAKAEPEKFSPAEILVELASDDALKTLYRSLALTYHPDTGNDSSGIMLKVNQAWEAICKQRGI